MHQSAGIPYEANSAKTADAVSEAWPFQIRQDDSRILVQAVFVRAEPLFQTSREPVNDLVESRQTLKGSLQEAHLWLPF